MKKSLVDPDFDLEALKYAQPIASRRFILKVIAEQNGPIAFKKLAKELGLDSICLLYTSPSPRD